MVLVAQDATRPWRSLVVTRARNKHQKLEPIDLVPRPVGPGDPVEGARGAAMHALAVCVDLFVRGTREPLPLFAGYSPAQHADRSGDGEWRTYDGRGDATRPAVRVVFGDIEVDELEEVPPRPDDPFDGTEGGRAEGYARYLWGTVAATCEDVT